ncbi:MAG: hypothetical protein M4579_002237 [Chaenotheca gracillima]|nr:MAG: hypothetical protein M4579_002237 [Chaenotheca gracillima]
MDQQKFIQLLQSVLAPDTERVKAATAELKKNYYTSPEALSFLLQILTSHPSGELRQLAAVEARSLVPKHWTDLPANQKPEIRTHLLQTTLNEKTQLVRHSSARVISAIAKLDLDDGEWADLPGFLQQAATSQDAGQREVGVYILFTLLEVMGEGFASDMSRLFTLFGKTIQDPESAEVRINTMMALSKMAMLLDAEEDQQSLEAFRTTLPFMVRVLKESVDVGDEDRTMQAFEVFQTLLGCDAQLLANHFKDLVQFMGELASSTDVDNESRSQAISFLMQCVKYRKLKIQGLKLGEPLTLKALHIVTELEDLNNTDDDATPARSALGLLDIMAQSLPPSQVIVPLMRVLPQYINNSDPLYRRAGILSLGFCVEGAPDFIATQLNDIFPLVLRLFDDSDVRVRQATLHALARLADDLAEEVGKEHAKFIPALIKSLDLATSNAAANNTDNEMQLDIIKASCGAIDSVFQGIEKEDAEKYVQELVPRLSRLFEHPDFKVKAAAAGAVGTVAAAAEDAFLPYFAPMMNALSHYVMIKDSEDELELRGTVCDAMGSIATAVGPGPFKDYVQPLMQASEEALHLDKPNLRETSFILWSTLSKVYEEDFTPFLDGVVKGLFESLKQDETDFEVELGEEAQDLLGTEVTIAGKKVKVSAAEGDGRATLSRSKDTTDEADIIDVEDADSDDEAWDELAGVTAVAQEKEIALEVIADVLTHTRGKFVPYLEQTVELVMGLVEHSYEGIRKASIGTLWRAYAMLWALCEDGQMEKWQPGLPLKVQPTAELAKLGEVAMTATLAVWKEEFDRGTVTDINQNLAAALKACGPAVLTGENVIKEITTILLSLIRKQHPCQQDLGDEEDMDILQESSEYDWLVIDNALDVIVGLATALGPTFTELWKIFEKPVMKIAGGSESIERSTSVGVIAECISSMGEAVTPYTTTLLKFLLHRVSDEDPETRSNAAFGLGHLCEKSGNTREILASYNTILSKLEPMLHTATARMMDNSAGCVSRMIMAHPDQVPIEDVVPVLVGLLPLKEDYEENEPVWGMIVSLYQSNNPIIQQQTPKIIPALAKVLSPPAEQLTDEIREKLTDLVKYLHQHQRSAVESNETLMNIAKQ